MEGVGIKILLLKIQMQNGVSLVIYFILNVILFKIQSIITADQKENNDDQHNTKYCEIVMLV